MKNKEHDDRDFSSCLEKKSTEVEAASFWFFQFFIEIILVAVMWILFSFRTIVSHYMVLHYQKPSQSPQPPQAHLNNLRALHPSKNPNPNNPSSIYFASFVYYNVLSLFLFISILYFKNSYSWEFTPNFILRIHTVENSCLFFGAQDNHFW